MFRLIKQVFSGFLSFSVSLNNESYMISPTLIDLNPVELKYYPFIISLDECRGSCNFVDDLYIKICVPSKTKDINVKVFNMITNKNEAKTMVNHISCDYKYSSATCNSDQKWNNETSQCEYKNYRTCQKTTVRIPEHIFVKKVSIQKALLMIQKLYIL